MAYIPETDNTLTQAMANQVGGGLNYDNLWNIWQQAREQNPPEGFSPVKNREGAPPNYFLTPEDMMTLINALTPNNLYTNPDTSRKEGMFNYPTSAMNISNYSNMGVPNTIIQASQDPQSQLSYLQTARKYKFPIYKQGPQAIYEHEIGHYQDPRLNNYRMGSTPNYGWTTFGGLSGGLLQRELPAMTAEERYWESLGIK